MEAPSVQKSFYAELKSISPDLSLVWEDGLERFVIFYLGHDGKDYRITEIKDGDGGYRHPDQRVLTMLRRCDMSTKVEDPDYLISEQFRQAAIEKKKAKEKNRADLKHKAREEAPKWAAAAELARDKGIVKDSHVDNKRIQISVPGMSGVSGTTQALLNKLGAPAGNPKIII